jgi:hypothetical protein
MGAVWAAVVVIGLWLMRSRLWQDLRQTRRAEPIGESRAVIERTEGGAQP